MLEEFTEPEEQSSTQSYPKPKPNGRAPNMPRPSEPTRERVVHNTPTDEDIESWGITIRKG